MKKISLSAYSTASAILLGLSNEVKSQMIYQDIDPDVGIGEFHVDFNADGISEMVMQGSGWWTFTSSNVYSSWQIEFLNYAEIATSAGPFQLYAGDTVDGYLDFNTADQLFFYGYNHDGWIDVDAGASWINHDSYIGMRFDVDGHLHYGWIRVRLNQDDAEEMPSLIVKELAWNATPDAPAPINPHVGVATLPVLSDVGETNTASDLQLSFQNAEDESHVSAYRVMLFTGFTPPTLAEANGLSADRYTEVIPTGGDVTMLFSEATLDVDGNPLVSGISYRAIILSVADGIEVVQNELSLPSNSMQFIFREAPYAEDIFLGSTGFTTDITGFTGQFYLTDLHVSEVRAYITDGYVDASTLMLLSSEYYTAFMPEFGTNNVSFPPDKLIYSTLTPVLYERYYMHIVSVPDSVNNSIVVSDYDYADFKYQDYNETPTVTLVDSTGTAADIQLHFPSFSNEDDLELYRIFIAKADELIYPGLANVLSATKRLDISPDGTDLDVNLSAILHDTEGTLITYDQPYKVYVALKGDIYPDYYSLSEPSVEFVLESPLVDPIASQDISAEPAIWLHDQIIHIAGASNEEHLVTLLNGSGQVVFQTYFTGTEAGILIPELPAGIYVVKLEDRGGMHHQALFLQGR